MNLVVVYYERELLFFGMMLVVGGCIPHIAKGLLRKKIGFCCPVLRSLNDNLMCIKIENAFSTVIKQ